METSTLVILTSSITAASTLIGVATTNYFNMRTTRISKESEERKHHKEIVVNAAIANWKQTAELATKSGLNIRMAPLDTFMVHMSALADVIFDPTTNADNLTDRLRSVDTLSEIAQSEAKDLRRIPKADNAA